MKRTIPILITFTVGFVLVVQYFVPALGSLSDLANIHFNILAAIAFVLGGANLLYTHGRKVARQQAGWGYSFVAVAAFLLTLGFGVFKVGVPPRPGFWTNPPLQSTTTPGAIALVQLDLDSQSGERVLTADVRRGPPETTHEISVNGAALGTIALDASGRGRTVIRAPRNAPPPLDALSAAAEGAAVAVGALVSGSLAPYPGMSGEVLNNGGAFWFMIEYGFQPLQQTTFALLAFYVASAAFRAFRARNVESILLLGTAFLILLGRTYLGTALSEGLIDPARPPEGLWEQCLSFFYIPNLTGWLMTVLNNAGNRAIMIGIALGVASTSLKVLLGIERSYLGSEKR